MKKSEMLDQLRQIRASIETDEEQFSDEEAERIIEKVDGVIHSLDK